MYIPTFEQFGSARLQNKEDIAKVLLTYYQGAANPDETCRSKAALLEFFRGKTPNSKNALMQFVDEQDDADRLIYNMCQKGYIESSFGTEWVELWAKWVESGEWRNNTHSIYYRPLLDAVKRQPYDGMVLYRAISVPNDKDVLQAIISMYNYTGAGIYWSYSFNGAIDYEADMVHTSNTYIMEVKAPYGIINAGRTLYKSIYPLAHEREVELNAGSVDLLGMWSLIENDGYAVKKNGLPTKTRTTIQNSRFAKLALPAMKIKVA